MPRRCSLKGSFWDRKLTVLPSKAHEPAVVCILSFVAMLSLTSIGTPCNIPLALPWGEL